MHRQQGANLMNRSSFPVASSDWIIFSIIVAITIISAQEVNKTMQYIGGVELHCVFAAHMLGYLAVQMT